MNFADLQPILLALGAEIRLKATNKMFVVQLSRDADRTIVIVADPNIDRAVETAIARFIEVRRKNPTAPSYIEYPTVKT